MNSIDDDCDNYDKEDDDGEGPRMVALHSIGRTRLASGDAAAGLHIVPCMMVTVVMMMMVVMMMTIMMMMMVLMMLTIMMMMTTEQNVG